MLLSATEWTRMSGIVEAVKRMESSGLGPVLWDVSVMLCKFSQSIRKFLDAAVSIGA